MTRSSVAVVLAFAVMAGAGAGASAWGQATAPDKGDVVELWTRLGGTEEEAEGAASWLVSHKDAATVVLERLIPEVDGKAIAALVPELDADQFAARERAQQRIAAFGKAAQPLLEKELEKTQSPEVAERLRQIIKDFEKNQEPTGAEARRQVRGVRVLEQLPEARKHLARVAEDAPWAGTRQAAKDALVRLERRDIEGMIASAMADARAGKGTADAVKAIMERVQKAGLEWDEYYESRGARIAAAGAAAKRVARLKEELAAEDKAETRKEVVRLLVNVLDDPAGALAVAAKDDGDRPMLELAAKKPGELTVEQVMALAGWYAKRSEAGDAVSRMLLAPRAGALVDALEGKTLTEEQQKALGELRQAVESELAQVPGEGGWRDLLVLADVEKHAMAGEWLKEKGTLRVKPSEFGQIALPMSPEGSYELRVVWQRTEGQDGVVIGFPAGKSRCNLNIGGWGNTVTGLETVNGIGADGQQDPNLAVGRGVENGKFQDYRIRVEPDGAKVKIAVTINGKSTFAWEGLQAALNVHNVWDRHRSLNVVLGAHKSDVTFKSVRVKLLSPGKTEARTVNQGGRGGMVNPPVMIEPLPGVLIED